MSKQVIEQYHREDLYGLIVEAFKKQGKPLNKLGFEDLWPIDQFHIGGAESTLKLIRESPIKQGDKLLDAGCGLGGPCRLFAAECGCYAYGIDLTPAYVDTATRLSKLVRMEHSTSFQVADALQLPFADGYFDVVWTQHVQMNVEAKADFYQELLRVLKPDGHLIYHDLFKGDHTQVIYPTPWSDNGDHSYLFAHSELEAILQERGMSVNYLEEDTAFAIAFFMEVVENINNAVKPPLGLHLIMDEGWADKMSNILANLQSGALRVYQGVYSRQ